MGLGILRTGKDHSIVEDNCAQRQGFSFLDAVYG
jgi:hypothetical protein